METYDFSPKDVLDAISIEDFLKFLIYSLEYRSIVMEQMSHEREVRVQIDIGSNGLWGLGYEGCMYFVLVADERENKEVRRQFSPVCNTASSIVTLNNFINI